MCGINAVGAQGCGCMVRFCHASLKMAILLHKEATVRFDPSESFMFSHGQSLVFTSNTLLRWVSNLLSCTGTVSQSQSYHQIHWFDPPLKERRRHATQLHDSDFSKTFLTHWLFNSFALTRFLKHCRFARKVINLGLCHNCNYPNVHSPTIW